MKTSRGLVVVGFICALNLQSVFADDLDIVLEALEQTQSSAPESTPKQGTFYTFQHVRDWPALPANIMDLPFWDIGNGFIILDDRNVDYAAIQAEAAAKAEDEEMMFQNSMMNRSFNILYDGEVYLTDFAATLTNGTVIAGFDIAGGTNLVPYDIWMTTNLLKKISQLEWTWLGIGYTSNRYTFTNQSADQAFYALASPQRTMTIAWGANSSGQCNVPAGLSNAMMMVGGVSHSIALLNNSNLVAWGDNTYGQTNIPAGLTNAVVITANGYHNLALRADGTVSIWGDWFAANNHYGVDLPTGLTNIVAVAAGWNHDLVVRSNGTVVAWSYYTTTPYTAVPTNLPPAKDVAAGQSHSVALLSDGTVAAWGENYGSLGWGVTNIPPGLSNVVAIAAGDYHTLALQSDGKVVAWGAGNSIYGFWFADLGQSIVPSGLSNVVAIAAGGYHSMALKNDGTVVVWGDMTTPGFPLNQIIGVGFGWDHALVLRTGNSSPLITSQPVNQSAQPSQTVTFSVQAISLAALQYQWQFNGVAILNATNSTLVLTNVNPLQQGYYQVVVSGGGGSIASSNVVLRMLPSNGTNLPVASTNWIQGNVVLTVPSNVLTNLSGSLQFQWLRDGVPISGAIYTNYGVWFFPSEAASWEGSYSVNVTGTSGSTNIGTWRIYYLLPGGVVGWGKNDYGQYDRPAGLTNILSLAAGDYHSVAVKDDGSVVQWGYNWGNVPGNLTNATAVAAGSHHGLALKVDGTVVAWGWNDFGQTNVPANTTNIVAISAGGQQSLALKMDGTVLQWGQTNAPIPAGLTNVMAIASGTNFHLALLRNSTVIAWGANAYGQTNVPVNLCNVVAIAAGGAHALALKVDGTVTAWGALTNVPANLTNIMNVAAGENHSVALKNDGTVICWGDNSFGQTNVVSGLDKVKFIAGGRDFTLAAQFSPLVQYPVDVTKDLLLIYNTNSADSIFVKDYYLAHRPMIGGANVLGIGCAPFENVSRSTFTNLIRQPILNWLTANPTKHPQYLVLFLDLPSRINAVTNVNVYVSPVDNSVSYELYSTLPSNPFVTHINMNGTNDCKAYIDKLEFFGTNYSPGKLIISASEGGYGNTNYVLDGIRHGNPETGDNHAADGYVVSSVTNALLVAGVSSNQIRFYDGLDTVTNGVVYTTPHPTGIANVTGYICWGVHSSLAGNYALNGTVQWQGHSGWWIVETIESLNGMRADLGHGNFIKWFSPNAFGGTNYSNIPIGAVCHTDEPFTTGVNNPSVYFNLWATGKNFAIAAWNSRNTSHFQAVGDPFVSK